MENFRLLRRAPVAACMTCPLCKDILEEATSISLCLHAFCKKCIYGRFSDKGYDTCPVCDVYLGATPQDKLRPDRHLQAIRENIFPREKADETSESAPPSAKQPSKRKDNSTSSLASRTKRRSKSGSESSTDSSSSSLNWPPKGDKEDEMVKPPSSLESIDKTIAKKKLVNEETKPCINQADNEEAEMECLSKVAKRLDDGFVQVNTETKPCINNQNDNEEAARKCVSKVAKGPDTSKPNSSRGKSESSPAPNADDGATRLAEPEKNVDNDRLISVDVMRLNRANMPVWFSLVASEEKEEGARLPQLSSRFLKIKTSKMAVSYIQKYIANKFELAKEDEVVIKFQGEALLPSSLLCEVEERWIRLGLGLGLGRLQTKVGRSAEEFVMPLTYSRNQNQAQQPSVS